MADFKSPRPTPKFFIDDQTLSTKREKSTPRDHYPPKPPAKSVAPVSRFFPNRLQVQRAQAVSFRESESSLNSKNYDESSKELYFDQCFQSECQIGAGSFGQVFKVKSKENGKFYAVKKSKEAFKGESDRHRKLQEVAKHEQLPKHPNCVQFIKAWEERGHLYIQTELCETSLGNYAEQIHDIPEKLIWNYLVDLLLAVKHLHDHNLVHMDIKPANIFISKNGSCKLGDFGLVIDLSKGAKDDPLEGDPKYLARETMDSKYTKAADIFSLGITILELACDLNLPPHGDIWQNLRTGKIPFKLMKPISSDLQRIIKLMMLEDYRRRPTVDRLLMDSAIQKIIAKRKRDLFIATFVSSVRDMFFNFVTLVGNYFSPLVNWWYRKSRFHTPSPRPSPNVLNLSYTHQPEWNLSMDFNHDINISDDECFEVPNLPSNFSLHSPNLTGGGSGENGYRGKLVNSTPTAQKSKRGDASPASQLMDSFDEPISPIAPDLRETLSKSNIGPKNLLEVFDAVAGDEN